MAKASALKFGLRDLLWLMIVAALMMVIFTNMFAYRAKHRELMNRLQATQEEALQSKLRAETTAAKSMAMQKQLEAALDKSLDQFNTTSTTDEQPDFDQSPKQQIPRQTK